MKKETIIIGTRSSKLALWQAEYVKKQLENKYKELKVELKLMTTKGDKILDAPLAKIGGKGLFTKELETAMLAGNIDIAVHSLKDMPMEVPEELPIVAFSKREDPRDVLVLPEGANALDLSKPIGCSSQRRILQLQKMYPEATFKSVRGNVLTRLKKLDDGEYGGLILAAAGLKRLGLKKRISRYYEPDEVIPAAGQGILAVQGRQGEDYSYLEHFADREGTVAALCERAFVRYLDGGCSSPVAAHAVIKGDEIFLRGLYYQESTGKHTIGTMRGSVEDPETLGVALAKKLIREAEG